jgi:hypothetical protein
MHDSKASDTLTLSTRRSYKDYLQSLWPMTKRTAIREPGHAEFYCDIDVSKYSYAT